MTQPAESQDETGFVLLPPEIGHLAGRIMDPDSHVMLPAQVWVEELGPEFRAMADQFIAFGESEEEDKNSSNIPDFPGDVAPVTRDIVNVKGSRAPGAIDARRRLAVMDAMGIRQQLVFPTGPANFLLTYYANYEDPNVMAFVKKDRLETITRLLDLHNDWLLRCQVADRVRPVPILFGKSPKELIDRATDLLDRGARAVWLAPAGELPGGVSPAHPDLDPLWTMFEARKCAIILHVGGGGGFLKTERWQDAPAFDGYVINTEFPRSPWYTAHFHMSFENMLMTMTLGGVFDRHPDLRVGCLETAIYWVGPMLRRLDLWYDQGKSTVGNRQGSASKRYHLPERPSFYLRRNVRITPFIVEDDIADDITRYGLEDMVLFSTDYPHVEGGRHPAETFYNKVKSLDPALMEKFFVTNADWIMPA